MKTISSIAFAIGTCALAYAFETKDFAPRISYSQVPQVMGRILDDKKRVCYSHSKVRTCYENIAGDGHLTTFFASDHPFKRSLTIQCDCKDHLAVMRYDYPKGVGSITDIEVHLGNRHGTDRVPFFAMIYFGPKIAPTFYGSIDYRQVPFSGERRVWDVFNTFELGVENKLMERKEADLRKERILRDLQFERELLYESAHINGWELSFGLNRMMWFPSSVKKGLDEKVESFLKESLERGFQGGGKQKLTHSPLCEKDTMLEETTSQDEPKSKKS